MSTATVARTSPLKETYALFIDKAYGTPERTQRTLVLCLVMLMVGATMNAQSNKLAGMCGAGSPSALVR